MSDCCTPQSTSDRRSGTASCPTSGTKGKRVGLITLKSLLTPDALASLDAEANYSFCPDAACDTVYFSSIAGYGRQQVKVPVFQKDAGECVPACYCFDWTRAALAEAVADGEGEGVPASIAQHVKDGRCGCEVNNPQGSCCLGNVRKVLAGLNREEVAV
jgi:hypothetical protein